jgi:membrane fusion protein, multidrug efflux system
MRKSAAFVVASSLLALVLAGCAGRDADPAEHGPEKAPVVVVEPMRKDVVRSITLPGDLVGWYQATLYAKVSGYLKHIDVDKGDWVKQGQVLAEIEVPELEQKLRRARARLQVERVTYDRLKGVLETDPRLVARQDVDVAEGKFEQAKAEADELEALVGYTKIVAPFSGVITARYVDPGALIQASGRSGSAGGGGKQGVPIVDMADVNRLRVYVYVPEEEVAEVRRDMPATLALHEFPGRTFTGKVARFATSLDLSTRTMLTEVDLDNPTHELYPGMYADVALELVRHPNAWTLPPTAIGTVDSSAYVYVVHDGRLMKAPVVTGLRETDAVEVASGLSGGEQVVRNIGPALSDGEPVEPVERAAGKG